MNCLETFKSVEDITLIRYYATGKLEMQGSPKRLHLYHYGNYLCLITGECNIFLCISIYLYIPHDEQPKKNLPRLSRVFPVIEDHASTKTLNTPKQ